MIQPRDQLVLSSLHELDVDSTEHSQAKMCLMTSNSHECDADRHTYPGASRSDPSTRNEAVHEALVSATWDAVAIMNALPR